VDAMDGMLKQEGGVNKASLMGSEPKLTSSGPLEKGEDSDEPVWLVSTRALSAGSCFIARPYCAASPQASHRACPALGLATKELYAKTCALYPRSQERSLTAHLVSSGLAAQKVVADECRQNSHKTICVRLTGTTAGVAVEFSTAP